MPGTEPATVETAAPSASSTRSVSRRGLFGALAGAAGGAAVTAAGFAIAGGVGRSDAESTVERLHGSDRIPCHGAHQAGITTAHTAHVSYLALDLLPGADDDGILRMLRLLSGDIEALTAGTAPLADVEPELAELPARLTVTVGFGRELVRRVDPAAVPTWLGPLPKFSRDRLEEAYSGGDLLLAIAADDPVTIAHAARFLVKDVRPFAKPRWRQDGFARARGTESDGRTMRNLMGQVDGTVNPKPGASDFAGLVWHGSDAGWLENGSALVLRRIRMELDTWDRVDRVGREFAMGRTLREGAPLTGKREHDEPDFAARDALGFTVISKDAHIARAHSTDPSERIYRRAVNYDDGLEQGLLFACYQRDPLAQFVPIQKRLDEADLMNEWVTHIGSAVFAIPPGWRAGGRLGETLVA